MISEYEKNRDQILITAYGKMAECLKLKKFKEYQIHFLSEYFAKYVYKAHHFGKEIDKITENIDAFITYVNDFSFTTNNSDEIKVRYVGEEEPKTSDKYMKKYKQSKKSMIDIRIEILKERCESLRKISSISDENDRKKEIESLENLNKVYMYFNDLIRNNTLTDNDYNDRSSPDGIYLFIFILYDHFIPLIYHDKPDESKINQKLFWKRLTDGKQMKYVYDFENSFNESPEKGDDKEEIYAFLRKTHTKDASEVIVRKIKSLSGIDDLIKCELNFNDNNQDYDKFKDEILDSSFSDPVVKNLVKSYYARNKMILKLSEERLKNTFPERKIDPFYIISFANTFFGLKDESRKKYLIQVNNSLIKKHFADHYDYFHRKHPNRRSRNHNDHLHQSYLFILQTINLVSPLEVNIILNHTINNDKDVLREILKLFKDGSKDLYEFFYKTIMNLHLKYIEGEVTVDMVADVSEIYGLLAYEAEPRYNIKYKCGLEFETFLVTDFIHTNILKEAYKIAKENLNFTSSIEDNDKIKDSIEFYEELKKDFKLSPEHHTFDSLIGFKEMTKEYLDKHINRHNRHRLHPMIFIYLKRAYFNSTRIGDTTLNKNPDKIVLVDSNEPQVEEVFKSLFSEVYSIVTPFVEGNKYPLIERIDFACKGAYDGINKRHHPNKYTKDSLKELLKKELENDTEFRNFFNLITKESSFIAIEKILRMEKFDNLKLAFAIVGVAMEIGIAESSVACMANITNLAMKTAGVNSEDIKRNITSLFSGYKNNPVNINIINKAEKIINEIIKNNQGPNTSGGGRGETDAGGGRGATGAGGGRGATGAGGGRGATGAGGGRGETDAGGGRGATGAGGGRGATGAGGGRGATGAGGGRGATGAGGGRGETGAGGGRGATGAGGGRGATGAGGGRGATGAGGGRGATGPATYSGKQYEDKYKELFNKNYVKKQFDGNKLKFIKEVMDLLEKYYGKTKKMDIPKYIEDLKNPTLEVEDAIIEKNNAKDIRDNADPNNRTPEETTFENALKKLNKLTTTQQKLLKKAESIIDNLP